MAYEVHKDDRDKGEPGHNRSHTIKIDRETYKVEGERLSGTDLRRLPQPHIGPERDLFQVVPGGSDRKITDADIVEIKDGMRFFTAPAQINPGSED